MTAIYRIINQRLSDFVGYDIVKHQVQERILPLLKGEAFRPNRTLPVLCLSGPNGVGKKWLTRCIAGEVGRRLIVEDMGQLVSGDMGWAMYEFMDMFRRMWANQPCIVYFDDFNQVNHAHLQEPSPAISPFREMLERELNRLASMHEDDVFFVFSAGEPERIEFPGWRVADTIILDPPDFNSRSMLFEHMIAHREFKGITFLDIDTAGLARVSSGFTANDIRDSIRITKTLIQGSQPILDHRALIAAIEIHRASLSLIPDE